MFAIYRKEISSYFINPIGYIYLGIFLVFSALLCCYTTIIAGTYNTSQYFFYLIIAFVILIPLLTMRLFAEERKMRTEQMLLTAPVTITGMVLGKYLAALTLFVGGVLLSCINFIPLYVIANAEKLEDFLLHINTSGIVKYACFDHVLFGKIQKFSGFSHEITFLLFFLYSSM